MAGTSDSVVKFSKVWMSDVISKIFSSMFVVVLIPFNIDRMELIEFLRSRDFLISNGRSLPYVHAVPVIDTIPDDDIEEDDEYVNRTHWNFDAWDPAGNKNTAISLTDWRDDNFNANVVDPSTGADHGQNYSVLSIDFDRFLMSFDKRVVVFINDYNKDLASCKASVIDCNQYYN